MNFFRTVFIAVGLVAFGNTLEATNYPTVSAFDQDHMIVTTYSLILLSPFETEDRITAYTDYGTLLWEVSIHPKVLSWKLKDGLLYVFSKSRHVEKTYLTCIDPATGYILWERP